MLVAECEQVPAARFNMWWKAWKQCYSSIFMSMALKWDLWWSHVDVTFERPHTFGYGMFFSFCMLAPLRVFILFKIESKHLWYAYGFMHLWLGYKHWTFCLYLKLRGFKLSKRSDIWWVQGLKWPFQTRGNARKHLSDFRVSVSMKVQEAYMLLYSGESHVVVQCSSKITNKCIFKKA